MFGCAITLLAQEFFKESIRATYGTLRCIFTEVGIQSPGQSGSEESGESLDIQDYLRTMVQTAFQ